MLKIKYCSNEAWPTTRSTNQEALPIRNSSSIELNYLRDTTYMIDYFVLKARIFCV